MFLSSTSIEIILFRFDEIRNIAETGRQKRYEVSEKLNTIIYQQEESRKNTRRCTFTSIWDAFSPASELPRRSLFLGGVSTDDILFNERRTLAIIRIAPIPLPRGTR